MKKILLILSASFLIFSCSTEDVVDKEIEEEVIISEIEEEDPEGDNLDILDEEIIGNDNASLEDLLGVWNLVARDLEGLPVLSINSCVSQGRIEFTEDLLTLSIFFEDNRRNCFEDTREGAFTVTETEVITDDVTIEDYVVNATTLRFNYNINVDLDGNGSRETTFEGTDVYEKQ